MSDQRRVRFATLGTLTRTDLPLVVDVWLGDAISAPWATRESRKLAGILASYILDPVPAHLRFSAISDNHHVDRDHARRALGMLSLFGLIEGYSTSDSELRAALRLSRLQMLRILEAKQRLAELEARGRDDELPTPAAAHREEPWLLPTPEVPVTAEPVAELLASSDAVAGRTARLLLKRMSDALASELSGKHEQDAA